MTQAMQGSSSTTQSVEPIQNEDDKKQEQIVHHLQSHRSHENHRRPSCGT
jgi:hypothetical protein